MGLPPDGLLTFPASGAQAALAAMTGFAALPLPTPRKIVVGRHNFFFFLRTGSRVLPHARGNCATMSPESMVIPPEAVSRCHRADHDDIRAAVGEAKLQLAGSAVW